MKQQPIWDKISGKWREYREKPIKEVIKFLREQENELAKQNKPIKILDLGCGSGRNFIKLENKKSIIYALDFSDKMLKYAEKYANKQGINIKAIKSETTKLPFSSNFFDTAIFIDSLHCIKGKENRKKALKELKRVLKKGSEAMLSVWNKNQRRFKNKPKNMKIPWTVDGKKYMRYYYLYEQEEFIKLLKDVGFKIINVDVSKDIGVGVKK